MKCVAERDCQAHLDNGKIKFFNRGDVESFKKCPPWFSPLEGKEAKVIDFATASEKEMTVAKWKFTEAAEQILDVYGVELEKKDGDRKSDIIERIVDIRFRHQPKE